ncbi:MAG: cupin domain-containing protein [Flavobacteriales bacterium]|nr:cupin domain-containing protein [Flavobacteriales bacterium]
MRVLFLTLILFICTGLFGQQAVNLSELQPETEYDNIHVKKLDTDGNSTTFMIWVKKGVKSHKHAAHSELIYVLDGEGNMTVGESTFKIGPGDYFRIPQNTFHALDVLSENAMKVISVQAPEFDGSDRIFDENDKRVFTKDKGY